MKRFLYLLEELVVYIFGFFVTNMIRAVFYLNSVKTYDDLDLWISCFRGNCTIKNTPDFFIYVIGLVLISLLFIFVWKLIKKIHLKIGKSKLYIALEIILFVIYVKSSGRRVTISFITSEAFEETTDYLRK